MIGSSWGGLHAVSTLLDSIPGRLGGAAIALAQHRGVGGGKGGLEQLLQHHTRWPVAEAGDKDPIRPGHVYLAPPDYHLLVEPGSFSLSVEERVHHARPSIDVLFESAADAYRERVIGIVLTGANDDGAAGLAAIKAHGGVALVQDPETAERATMPLAAIAATVPDAVLPLPELGRLLHDLCSAAPVREEARP